MSVPKNHGELLPRSNSAFYEFSRDDDNIISGKDLVERAKSLWNAIGILSGLAASISFSSLTAVLGLDIFKDDFQKDMCGLLLLLSAIFYLSSAVVITISWAALDRTTADKFKEFFEEYHWSVTLPGKIFIVGSIFLALGFFIIMYNAYSFWVFMVSVIITFIVIIFLSLLRVKMNKFAEVSRK